MTWSETENRAAKNALDKCVRGHPPVLPVRDFFKYENPHGWAFVWAEWGYGFALVDYAAASTRHIIAALQRCGWDDLRTEEDTEKIRRTLIKVGISAETMTRHEMEETCRAESSAWAAWGKD